MPWFIHLSIHQFIYSLIHTNRLLGPVLGVEEYGKRNMLTKSLISNFMGNFNLWARYDQL